VQWQFLARDDGDDIGSTLRRTVPVHCSQSQLIHVDMDLGQSHFTRCTCGFILFVFHFPCS